MAKASAFDFILVTDVTSYFMEEYEQPVAQEKPNCRVNKVEYYIIKAKELLKKFFRINNLCTILFLLLFIAGVLTNIYAESKWLIILASFISGTSFLGLLFIYLIRTLSIVKWFKKNKNDIEQEKYFESLAQNSNIFSEKIMRGIMQFFRASKIGFLEQMFKARIMSLLSLVLDINLKQTRRLIYEMFYEDEIWENRRVPNFIYELSTLNKISRANRFNNIKRLHWEASKEDKILLLDNCDALNEIAEDARTMGTTLWFSKTDIEKQKLKRIIAAGQFTTCCNLLEYVISLERKGVHFDESVSKELNEIKLNLTKDFNRFKKEPFYLFDKMETS